MPIQFRCANCGRLLQVPEETAGQEAECAHCGHRQAIPLPSEAAGLPPLPKPFASPAVAERVQAPAIALMVWGGLGLLVPLVHLLGISLRLSLAGPFQFLVGPIAAGGHVLANLPFLVAAGVIGFGGWSMYRLEHRHWAMAGAAVALVPCFSPCCLVGIPLGIWALSVLNEPPVQGAFRS